LAVADVIVMVPAPDVVKLFDVRAFHDVPAPVIVQVPELNNTDLTLALLEVKLLVVRVYPFRFKLPELKVTIELPVNVKALPNIVLPLVMNKFGNVELPLLMIVPLPTITGVIDVVLLVANDRPLRLNVVAAILTLLLDRSRLLK